MSDRCGICQKSVSDLTAHLRDDHGSPSLTDVLRGVQEILPPPSDRDVRPDDE